MKFTEDQISNLVQLGHSNENIVGAATSEEGRALNQEEIAKVEAIANAICLPENRTAFSAALASYATSLETLVNSSEPLNIDYVVRTVKMQHELTHHVELTRFQLESITKHTDSIIKYISDKRTTKATAVTTGEEADLATTRALEAAAIAADSERVAAVAAAAHVERDTTTAAADQKVQDAAADVVAIGRQAEEAQVRLAQRSLEAANARDDANAAALNDVSATIDADHAAGEGAELLDEAIHKTHDAEAAERKEIVTNSSVTIGQIVGKEVLDRDAVATALTARSADDAAKVTQSTFDATKAVADKAEEEVVKGSEVDEQHIASLATEAQKVTAEAATAQQQLETARRTAVRADATRRTQAEAARVAAQAAEAANLEATATAADARRIAKLARIAAHGTEEESGETIILPPDTSAKDKWPLSYKLLLGAAAAAVALTATFAVLCLTVPAFAAGASMVLASAQAAFVGVATAIVGAFKIAGAFTLGLFNVSALALSGTTVAAIGVATVLSGLAVTALLIGAVVIAGIKIADYIKHAREEKSVEKAAEEHAVDATDAATPERDLNAGRHAVNSSASASQTDVRTPPRGAPVTALRDSRASVAHLPATTTASTDRPRP